MDVQHSLNKLRAYIEKHQYMGYDPYDALNSPFLRTLAPSKYSRIFVTQLLKYSPWNFRKFLLISPQLNPKGLGLFLGGYAKLYAHDNNPDLLAIMAQLREKLLALASPGYSGCCWGYNFPWQSRAFYLPRFTPTVVNTSFIGHALLDCFEVTADAAYLSLALSSKEFILHDLHRTYDNRGFCFSYTPMDTTAIHNANVLGASLLIRLAKYIDQQEIATAQQSLAYTMSYQREDGSWPYAETSYQGWSDSFHTGFILESLGYFLEQGWALEYQEHFKRGWEFYLKNFFLEDGTCKYYHDQIYPLDIHAFAHAVTLLSKVLPEHPLLPKVLSKMIAEFQDASGYFYFRRHPWGCNRIPYMRWSQAWAFRALCEFLFSHYQRDNNS